MSHKSSKIAALVERWQGKSLDARYLGYVDCFNRGLYYESHDVLEDLWLPDRHGPDGAFYKGLIQFAGAFVHLQKHTVARPRLRPAAALLKLARTNLAGYSPGHRNLDLENVRQIIEHTLKALEAGEFAINPLSEKSAPTLSWLEEV